MSQIEAEVLEAQISKREEKNVSPQKNNPVSAKPNAPKARFLYAGIFLGIVLFIYMSGVEKGFKPDEAALGKQTSVAKAFFHGKLVADTINLRELENSFRAFRAEDRRVAFWLGASQLHAIFQPVPEDALAVQHANQLAEKRNSSLVYVQVSSPNGSLQDLLGFYLIFRQEGLVPDSLIIALTYDDLREPQARDEVLLALPKANEESLRIGGEGIRHLYDQQRLFQLKEIEKATDPIKRPDTHATLQVRLEKYFIEFLENHWSAYKNNSQLSARLETWGRHFLMEIVADLSQLAKSLGRTRSSKQALPESKQQQSVPEHWKEWNMSAFDSLISLAQEDGVKVIVYKPPHRQDEKVFYHPRAEYDAYFKTLKEFCDQKKLYFADFETLVPFEDWRTDSTDPFHFNGRGHEKLGRAIDDLMGQIAQEKETHAI